MRLNKIFFKDSITYTEQGEIRLSIRPTKIWLILAILRIAFKMIFEVLTTKETSNENKI